MGFFSNLFKNQKESASAPTKSEPLPLELQMESLFATVALVGLAMLDFKFDFHNIHDEGPGYYGIKNTHDDSTRRRRKQWARKRKRDETIVHYQLLLDYWPDGGETVVVPSRPPKNDFVALMGALAECDQAIRSRRLSPREAAELVKSKTFLVRDFCENYESGTSALLGTHLRTVRVQVPGRKEREGERQKLTHPTRRHFRMGHLLKPRSYTRFVGSTARSLLSIKTSQKHYQKAGKNGIGRD
ncbi:hypothetical protein T439DRAFT_164816 [Meredithblackwellia eburnea MCA 4105]